MPGACIRHRSIAAPDVICDQTIVLNGFYSRQALPRTPAAHPLPATPSRGKRLVFLTNQFTLPALTICALYKSRWQVELFFKWIKQHLRIKRFYGTSENAVQNADLDRRRPSTCWWPSSRSNSNSRPRCIRLLQILSVTIFEKLPLQQVVAWSTD